MRYKGKQNGIVAPRSGDVGYDLRAAKSTVLLPGTQQVIPTGIYLEIPEGKFGFIRDRSSLALEQLYVGAGVIDSSYRGEIHIVMGSLRLTPFVINEGDRIAQIILIDAFVPPLLHLENGELTETRRGDGKFGSTGK
jgi:dUTP pyrophosphatase